MLICDRNDVRSVVCISLAARILWRMDKEGSVVSDTQLTTLEELEDHIYDISEEDAKDFKVDIHNFLDYWPRSSKPHTVDNVSHILGVVRQLTIVTLGVQMYTRMCCNSSFMFVRSTVTGSW